MKELKQAMYTKPLIQVLGPDRWSFKSVSGHGYVVVKKLLTRSQCSSKSKHCSVVPTHV